MTALPLPTRRSEFWAGVKDTFPLVVGATPFGVIFGATAIANGLSPAATMGMSVFVFAGTAQFIGSGLVAGGTSLAVIILTTFIVNLRHALYSASLAPQMKHLPQRWLAPLAFWLTDESFAVVSARYMRTDNSPYKHWYFFGSDIFMYINWNFWTYIGLRAGQVIPDARSLGLDFAVVVTFIGIVVPLVKNRPVLVSVVVAGLTAVLTNSLPNKMGLMIAALLGVTAGIIAEYYFPQPTPTRTASTADAERVEVA